MDIVLNILKNILSEPSILMGLIAFVGLILLKEDKTKILVGTVKPIAGYMMLGVGAGVIVSNLEPLGKIIQFAFNIQGVIPNNEAIVAVAQKVLGFETMLILIVGFASNLIIARITKFKYIFLTGHHSFFLAALLSAVLQATGMVGSELVLIGGFLLGAWSSISPAIGQRYTDKVTDNDGIAMGHFSSLGYYLSAFIASKFGNAKDSFSDNDVPEKWNFLSDTTITTSIIMVLIYTICSFFAGSDYIATISDKGIILFSVMSGIGFAVGVTIVYNGIRLILSELIPAFQGISDKLIPNSIPAVDCAVFFTYSPTAVIVGFISSFLGGIVALIALGGIGAALIIPGMVPHFFCGGTAGVYGDKLGGKKGCIAGAFINGLLLGFLPALLLPVLGNLGFANTTFGDVDFTLMGIILGYSNNFIGQTGIYLVTIVFAITLIVPSLFSKKQIVGMSKN
ncbi:PTS ascorbate transporter subunit IIC [Vibrio sp. NTOU-M3]|uniref:PTS ascorbate transporter subunit IIC n=1 Tax=Vibrio sp. NTOU-M3 TaxID=3234954 RepID=UPI00349F3D96